MSKDKRSQLSQGDKTADFTKSLDIWYADGSVVLVAETTAYRVHTSILASACEVFRDMATIPQPAEGDREDTYEGCPVLRLQDSATELYHFLKAIYDFSYFRPGIKKPFPVVAAVLHLSTKYIAPVLRRQAVEMFTTAYPSTWGAWKARSTARLVAPTDNEFAAVLALAEQADVRALLPAAFYFAAGRPLAETLAQLHALPLGAAAAQELATRFLLGHERLQRAAARDVLAFLRAGFALPGCQTGNDANALMQFARVALERMAQDVPYYEECIRDPAAVGANIGLCANCANLVRDHIEKALEDIWKGLSGMFGLPGWDVLTANDDVHQAS